MQRQSLGSPSSKLVVKDHEQLICETQKPHFPSASQEEEEEEATKKMMMMMRLNHNKSSHENYIHLIPMLTLLCFLILYLSSHDPSLNDLAQFNISNTFGSEDNISELQEIVEMKKGDILGIRSLKNLEQAEATAATAKHRRLHRKFAHH